MGPWLSGLGGRGSHQGLVRAGLEQAGWLLGHPFAAWSAVGSWPGGMMGCAASGRSGSIRTRDLAADQDACGGHDLHDP